MGGVKKILHKNAIKGTLRGLLADEQDRKDFKTEKYQILRNNKS